MIGQCFSKDKWNIVILAAGAGSRMGEASMYIPKALSPLGEMRAIDWLILRYANVAHKFIIGTHTHYDLLINYIAGRYPASIFEFVTEKELVNNARSATLCLDKVNSRYPTLVLFCDLIMLDNFELAPDRLFIATKDTLGNTGTFRHHVNKNGFIEKFSEPKDASQCEGVLGVFSFGNTPLLKAIAYSSWEEHTDFTDDVVIPYREQEGLLAEECKKVVEFGNQTDLIKARELWEKTS